MSEHTPSWADRLLPHLRGAELVGRELLVIVLYLAGLVAVVWLIVGMIDGFISPKLLIPAGGIGGVVEGLRQKYLKA